MMSLEDRDIVLVDPSLWFEPGCCNGPHYLRFNPHVELIERGRMGAWCPTLRRTFTVRKDEIERCSAEALYWMRGFLYGAEPVPPVDEADNGPLEDGDPRLERWRAAVREFQETGVWVDPEEEEERTGDGSESERP